MFTLLVLVIVAISVFGGGGQESQQPVSTPAGALAETPAEDSYLEITYLDVGQADSAL